MSQVYDFEKQTSFLEDKPFLPTVFLDDAHQGKDTPYFQLTLLVIGSSGVGKTSLITSIVRKAPLCYFLPNYQSSSSFIFPVRKSRFILFIQEKISFLPHSPFIFLENKFS
ncbi:hypothetical protein HMI54_006391 [Coelomomyces lativittatus]|nr:hypothetical protein HMI54_006391 [Coelomomyces lativittatus]